jgi:Bacterial transcriptional activator domain/NB-ARC domain
VDGEAGALGEALAQWHGQPLAGMPSELLQREVVPRLAEQRLDAVERRLEVELRRGRHAELVGELLVLTAQHPLRERLWALLMRALDGSSRRADALEAYHTVRKHLADELGIDPSEELQELYTTILIGRPQPTLMPPVPRQLPLDVPAFTGRTGELARLDALLAGHAAATVVGVITGTAGIGKTALAVHWAHQVVDRFPDGQLWANLHGTDPEVAVPAGRTLRRFLRFLGVPDAELPLDVEDQIGLYRSLLDGRRMLVVLDDVGSPRQVRPLLPGAPGSLVLMTSRRSLSDLVAAEGAHPMRLDPLTPDEARRLLTTRLGADRIAADPTAVDEIVERCAGLPLALTMVAAHAATDPQVGLRTIAAELPDQRDGPHRPALVAPRPWRRRTAPPNAARPHPAQAAVKDGHQAPPVRTTGRTDT